MSSQLKGFWEERQRRATQGPSGCVCHTMWLFLASRAHWQPAAEMPKVNRSWAYIQPAGQPSPGHFSGHSPRQCVHPGDRPLTDSAGLRQQIIRALSTPSHWNSWGNWGPKIPKYGLEVPEQYGGSALFLFIYVCVTKYIQTKMFQTHSWSLLLNVSS